MKPGDLVKHKKTPTGGGIGHPLGLFKPVLCEKGLPLFTNMDFGKIHAVAGGWHKIYLNRVGKWDNFSQTTD